MSESDVQGAIIFPQRKQRRPGPDKPHRRIPSEQWPDVLHRIEQGGTLRQIATDYGVSYQTIHRIVLTMRKQGGQDQ
jgi:DNA invertase Pin-like site-specific DNA recombinase